MTEHKGSQVKDLSLLGRPLSRLIIIDNMPQNFSLQPSNGILIDSWYRDPNDEELLKLASLLLCIADSQFEDVRAHPEMVKRVFQQEKQAVLNFVKGGKNNRWN